MKFKISGMNVAIEYSLIATIFFMCFCKDILIKYIMAMFCIILHEIAHILVGKIFGLKASSINIYALGVKAKIDNIKSVSRENKLAIYLAGPISNLILAVTFYLGNKMEYADINYILCLINLLPVTPLDGGNILKDKLESMYGYKNGLIYSYSVSKIIICILTIFSILQFFYEGSISMAIFSLYLFYLIQLEKKKIRIINIIKDKIYY